jgi:curved DNA-binding protein CbpA
MRDPYESLAVPRSATMHDIKKSFRLLAKKLHPCTNKNNPRAAALFAEIKAAYEYEILGNEAKRRAFDRGDTFDRGRNRPEDNPKAQPSTIAISEFAFIMTSLIVAVAIIAASPLIVRSLMPQLVINASSDNGHRVLSRVEEQSEHGHLRLWSDSRLLFPQHISYTSPDPIPPGVQVGGKTPQKPAITPGPESVGATAVSESVADKALETSSLTNCSGIQSAANSQRNHEPIELLIGRSEKLISQGDVEAARMLLLPAAEVGDARAALALGATYDPVMLAILQVGGVAADVSLARYWYEKASELGLQQAQKRLQLLSVALAQPKGRVVRAPIHVAVSHAAASPVSAGPVPSIRVQLVRDDTSQKLPVLLGVSY